VEWKLRRRSKFNPTDAGFTLIEVLVALSMLAAAMAAIGGMIATNARGVRSIETHLKRLETARTIMTALPGRDQLVDGSLTGKIADHSWRVEVFPFALQNNVRQDNVRWMPRTIIVTARSPNGTAINVSTIRLQRSADK
jgi:general secretion pathway protein I